MHLYTLYKTYTYIHIYVCMYYTYIPTYTHTYIPVTGAGGFRELKGIALFQVTNPSRARALWFQKKKSFYSFRPQLWRAREGAWQGEGGESAYEREIVVVRAEGS